MKRPKYLESDYSDDTTRLTWNKKGLSVANKRELTGDKRKRRGGQVYHGRRSKSSLRWKGFCH